MIKESNVLVRPDNCVTLCKGCHAKFHKIYGYGNNTTEQFNEFKDGQK